MQHPRSQAAVHATHSALTRVLRLPWLPAAGKPAPLPPSQECWAVAVFLFICMGIALPIMLFAVLECAAFERFKQRHEGRVKKEWPCWLYHHVTAAPAQGGAVRWVKLSLMAFAFLIPVWDIVRLFSASH